MLESEVTGFEEAVLPETLDFVTGEVQIGVLRIPEDDKESAEFYEEIDRDYRLITYLFLQWVDATFNPKMVLYPASGFDKVPKKALGEERVIHVSLEEYEEDGQKYFRSLGSGKKVIAQNQALPFSNGAFQAVLLLDSPSQIVNPAFDEFVRVIDAGGLVILAGNILEDDNAADRLKLYRQSPNFIEVLVPGQFQRQGNSETEFFIFQKSA